MRCLARNPLQASEVGEALLVDLFLPDRSGHSRIASYDGRSSLATWLHVIVTHRVANERVRKWNTVERPGDVPDVADRSGVGELEADMRGAAVRARDRRVTESGLPAAERRASARCSCGDINAGSCSKRWRGRLSVHTSTVCRQLERLQDRIRKDVIATLSRTYGLQRRGDQ